MADKSELLPPGEYRSFEEAEKAAGYDIPRPTDSEGWLLEGIVVKGPDYGRFEENDADDFHKVRFVSLRYRRTATGDQVTVSLYFAGEDNRLVPAAGDVGPPTEMSVGGRPGILQTREVRPGGAVLVAIQWLEGDLHLGASGLLVRGLTVDELMEFLGRFE